MLCVDVALPCRKFAQGRDPGTRSFALHSPVAPGGRDHPARHAMPGATCAGSCVPVARRPARTSGAARGRTRQRRVDRPTSADARMLNPLRALGRGCRRRGSSRQAEEHATLARRASYSFQVWRGTGMPAVATAPGTRAVATAPKGVPPRNPPAWVGEEATVRSRCSKH